MPVSVRRQVVLFVQCTDAQTQRTNGFAHESPDVSPPAPSYCSKLSPSVPLRGTLFLRGAVHRSAIYGVIDFFFLEFVYPLKHSDGDSLKLLSAIFTVPFFFFSHLF